MKTSSLIIACALFAAASVSVRAECVSPKSPAAVPNGSTATKQEMIDGMTVFKKYQADMNNYLACLDSEAAEQVKAAGDNADQVKQINAMLAKKHNAAVDEETAHADKFNQQIRAYKAKTKG